MFITLWRTNVPPNLSRDWIMSSFWLDLCQLKCFTTCFTLTTMRLGCTLMPIIPYNLTARLEISDQNSTFLDPEMLNSNFESGARLPNGATSFLASAATVLSKKCSAEFIALNPEPVWDIILIILPFWSFSTIFHRGLQIPAVLFAKVFFHFTILPENARPSLSRVRLRLSILGKDPPRLVQPVARWSLKTSIAYIMLI